MEDPKAPPVVERVVVVAPVKSTALAAALGFFFGPLGLLYSTILGAVIMFGVNLLVGLVTFGFGLFLSWPICALWGFIAAKRHNERVLSSVAYRSF